MLPKFASIELPFSASSSSVGGFATDSPSPVRQAGAIFRATSDSSSAIHVSRRDGIQDVYHAYMANQNHDLQTVRQAATQQAIALLNKDAASNSAASQPHLSSAVDAAVTLAVNAAQLQAEARAQVLFFQSHSALLPLPIQIWLQQQVQMRLALAQQHQAQFFRFKQQHNGPASTVPVPTSDASTLPELASGPVSLPLADDAVSLEATNLETSVISSSSGSFNAPQSSSSLPLPVIASSAAPTDIAATVPLLPSPLLLAVPANSEGTSLPWIPAAQA